MKTGRISRLLAWLLCSALLCGLWVGAAPAVQAAVTTYKTVYMIADYASSAYTGMTNAAVSTAQFVSGPSAMRFAPPEGAKSNVWRTTYPEPVDLSCGGRYTAADLALAFWVYMDTADTGFTYMIQLASASGWGGAVHWNRWRTQLTTATGSWQYVVLPLSGGNNAAAFDITKFQGYRFQQNDNPSYPDFVMYVDDLQIVDLNSASYSWSAQDLDLTAGFDRDTVGLDDAFSLQCTLRNRDTAVDMTDWTLRVTANERLVRIADGMAEQTVTVPKGGSKEVTVPLTALEGGNTVLSLAVYDGEGHRIAVRDLDLTIQGKRQWYADDVALTLAWSNAAPASGQTAELRYSLRNLIDTADIRDWTLTCQASPLWTATDGDRHTLSVTASGTTEGAFAVTFSEGGSGRFDLTLTDDKGTVVTTASLPVTVDGRGYYLGDLHSHTVASDGADTYLENFQAGRARGMSWMYTTDHNARMAVSYDRSTFDLARDAMLPERFLALYGSEITTKAGHMVAYNINRYYIPASTDDVYSDIPLNVSADAVREMMAQVKADGGLLYMAHPFATTPFPDLGMDPANTGVYRDFTGIDIINYGESVGRYGGQTAGCPLQVLGTEYWDRMNLLGVRKYFGHASTDAHKSADVGWFFNGLLIDELSADQIHDALGSGRFYASSGPELRFSLGGKDMGQTAYGAAGSDLPLVVRAYNENAPLTKVVLYTFDTAAPTATAFRDGRAGAVVLYEDPTGAAGLHTFDYTGTLPLTDGGFARLEVYAADDLYGYAFSNPIWMTAGEDPGAAVLSPTVPAVQRQGDRLTVSLPAAGATVADLRGWLSPAAGVTVLLDGVAAADTDRLTNGMQVVLCENARELDRVSLILRADGYPAAAYDGLAAGITAAVGETAVTDVLYSLDDFTRYTGVGRTNADYLPTEGRDGRGCAAMHPGASVWRTGDRVDLTYYTGTDTDDLAMEMWLKADTLHTGARYTLQVTGSGNWSAPYLLYNFDVDDYLTETGVWTRVLLPFPAADANSLDLHSFYWYRLFQSNTVTGDFTVCLDDVSIVRVGHKPVFAGDLPADGQSLLPGGRALAFTAGESPVTLTDLTPALLSGAASASLVLDLFVSDAAALQAPALTAFWGEDDRTVRWPLDGLSTGWNRLVLPLCEGQGTILTGGGPAATAGQTTAFGIDSLRFDLSASHTVDCRLSTALAAAAWADVPQPADYTALDAVLADVPDDLSGYTAESVAALQEVLDAVTRDKTVAEQAVVDGWTAALRQALAALAEKPDDPPSPPAVTFGDVNGDGAVNAADALLALQHSVKLITLAGDKTLAADVNGDDAVNAADALLILQYSVKLIDRFPVGIA